MQQIHGYFGGTFGSIPAICDSIFGGSRWMLLDISKFYHRVWHERLLGTILGSASSSEFIFQIDSWNGGRPTAIQLDRATYNEL